MASRYTFVYFQVATTILSLAASLSSKKSSNSCSFLNACSISIPFSITLKKGCTRNTFLRGKKLTRLLSA